MSFLSVSFSTLALSLGSGSALGSTISTLDFLSLRVAFSLAEFTPTLLLLSAFTTVVFSPSSLGGIGQASTRLERLERSPDVPQEKKCPGGI